MVMTMANGWRSKEEIKAEYGYSEGTFNARMNECYCSDFADAIISDTSKFSTIDEPRYQQFLKWRSQQKRKQALPRLTRGRVAK